MDTVLRFVLWTTHKSLSIVEMIYSSSLRLYEGLCMAMHTVQLLTLSFSKQRFYTFSGMWFSEYRLVEVATEMAIGGICNSNENIHIYQLLCFWSSNIMLTIFLI